MGQKLWIFYYWPIFECEPFFLAQTLKRGIKIWILVYQQLIFPHQINSNQASAWPNSQVLIHIYSHITRPDAETLQYTYTTIYIQTIYIHKIYYIVVGQHLHIAPDFIGLS